MIKVPSGIRRGGSPEIKIDRFGGEDSSTVPTQIAINRAEEMVNMMLDTQGMLQQFPGFRKAISGTVSAGTTPVRMVTRNATADKLIKAHGGKLFVFTPGGAETEIYSGLTDAKTKDFVMGDNQYFQNGTDFIRWNGARLTFGTNTITTTGADFVGFAVGDSVVVAGCSITANNKTATITGVSEKVLTFGAGTFTAGVEAEGVTITENSTLTFTATTITTTGADFDFVVGETIYVSGCTVAPANNKSAVITVKTAKVLTFASTFVVGVETTGVTISGASKSYIQAKYNTTVETVESVAYVPTTVIGRLPTGGGTAFEAVNLLQPKRKNSFIGDGATKIFQLDTVGLDATLMTAIVAGVYQVETTHFTVNRVTGVVTFITAPANGAGVDNTIITFAKTVTGYANRIKNCQFFAIFGVGNNLRVFMSGNPNFKNQDWYSAMQDPTYWPDLNYTKIGSEGVAIKGYALQQGVMHILKEDSNYDPTIWTRTAETYTDNTLYFPVRQNNSQIGLLATETVKGVDDVSVMLSKKGVYRITATYVAEERGLEHISPRMDARILREANLKDAIAFDFEGRYGIAINDMVYVLDYNNNYETYRWKGIPASCFYEYDSNLYFGDKNSGNVYVMNRLGDGANTDMLGDLPIESYWMSQMMSMDRANFLKMIDTISVTLVPVSARSNVDIYYRTNKRNEKFVKRISLSKFEIDSIDLENFSLLTSNLPQTVNREINVSDIIYFQLILKNSVPGSGLAIPNITIPYSFAGQI